MQARGMKNKARSIIDIGNGEGIISAMVRKLNRKPLYNETPKFQGKASGVCNYLTNGIELS
jgi:hypothetical protein